MSDTMRVVCAYPLSGQYGFGQRICIYLFIFGCFLGRWYKLILEVTLATFLVAALGIAVHVTAMAAMSSFVNPENAIDMDIFGTTYILAITSMATTAAVSMSSTYKTMSIVKRRRVVLLWAISMGAAAVAAMYAAIYINGIVRRPLPCTDERGHSVSLADFEFGMDCHLDCAKLRLREDQTPVALPRPSTAFCWANVSLFLLFNGYTGMMLHILPDKFEHPLRPFGSCPDIVSLVGWLLIISPYYLSLVGLVVLIVFAEAKGFREPGMAYGVERISAVGQWMGIVLIVLGILVAALLKMLPPAKDSELSEIGGQTQPPH